MKFTLTLRDWLELAGVTLTMLACLPIAVGLLAGDSAVLSIGLAVAFVGMIPAMMD